MKNRDQFIIKSTERGGEYGYFVAIHGYSPHFNLKSRARLFVSEKAARDYAREELFTNDSAFVVEKVTVGA